MKIPKIDTSPKRTNIEYPVITNWDVMKEYLKLMKPYKFMVGTIIFGVVIATIAEAVFAPLFYKKFFDLLTTISNSAVRDIAPLTATIFIVLGMNLIKWIGFRSAWFSTIRLEGHVMSNALRDSFGYLIEHSHSFFANNFTGSLTQRINRFSRSFMTIFERIVYDLIPLFLKVIGAGIVLYFSHPVIAYAIWVWIILFLAVSYVFTKYKLKYDIAAAATYSKLSGMFSDAISNHNTIQSFSSYKEEAKRIDAVNSPLRDLNIFRWNYAQTINAAQSFLNLAIEFFIFYYGIKYWNMGIISLGTFVLIQAYIFNIGTSLWSFSRIIRDLHEGIADAKEMVEILHLKHEIVDKEGAHPLKVDKGSIDYRSVSFAFGKGKPVFENMNISIKPGEKVAFIGSSGAGKSTLVKLLLRLYDIQKGEIFIDGQNIKNVTQETLRNNISLVPQDPALFHRTLMDNIRYGKKDATDEEVVQAAKLAHCHEFIESFPQKYETFVGERGVKLSGGERQRVAIARAILKNAPVLVLDEATSSLDSHSEHLIQDALQNLMKGKTVIVIAHRLSTIRQMDRIIVVSKGGVVEEGSHDQLIQKEGGVYSKLWYLQAHGFANESIEELLEEKEV